MGSKNNLTLLKPEKVSEDPLLHALRSLPVLPTEAIQQLFSSWGKIGGTGNNCGLLRGGVGSAGVNVSLISCVWDVGTVRSVQAVKSAGVTGLERAQM